MRTSAFVTFISKGRYMRLMIALVCIVLCGCEGHGRYQAVPAGGGNGAEEKVWIIDTKTGAARLCYESAAAISCLAPGADFDDERKK